MAEDNREGLPRIGRRRLLERVARVSAWAALGRVLPVSAQREADPSLRREWSEINLPLGVSLSATVERAKIIKAEVAIPQPRETGKFGDYGVFVYPNDTFPREQTLDFGIAALAEGGSGELILGWINGIGIAKKGDRGYLETYQSVTISSEFGISEVVYQIASTKENGVYFGGLDGFVWLNPEANLVKIADPTDLLGRLRRIDWFSSYGEGAIAARETELYYLEGSTLRKWITPMRNGLGRQDEILGLATGVIGESPVCYAVVSVNEGNNWTTWQRHLYRFSFSSDPAVSLGKEDLGVIPSFNKKILLAKLDLGNKVFYGREGTSGDKVAFISLETKEANGFKVAPSGEYPAMSGLIISGDDLWGTMEEVQGVFKIGKPWSSQRDTQQIQDLLANPYIDSIGASGKDIFTGHARLPGNQFNNALLTQFRREHVLSFPLGMKNTP